MRLIYKISIIYLVISIFAFAAGGVVTFFVIKNEIDDEQKRFLQERLTHLEDYLARKQPEKEFIRDKISVIPLPAGTPEKAMVFSDTLVNHAQLPRQEKHIKLDQVKKIGNITYKIDLWDLIIEEDDIIDGVVESIVKMYLILFLFTLVLSVVASRLLLKPFQRILAVIKSFDLKAPEIQTFPLSKTKELQQLSHFLNEMAEKMRHDYNSLKEFSENASHEMQTPLSIARGKLDLLLESENLTDEQLLLVSSAQSSIRRLSNLGSSLTLLTKIDNQEFAKTKKLNLSFMLQEMLRDFRELIEMKGLNLQTEIDPEVFVKANAALMELMLGNLLKNAINHNIPEKGEIRIELNAEKLVMENTGVPLKGKPEQAFNRFYKESRNLNSLGLGLSIVKKIIEVNHFRIDYINNDTHRLEITFPGKSSDLLQNNYQVSSE